MRNLVLGDGWGALDDAAAGERAAKPVVAVASPTSGEQSPLPGVSADPLIPSTTPLASSTAGGNNIFDASTAGESSMLGPCAESANSDGMVPLPVICANYWTTGEGLGAIGLALMVVESTVSIGTRRLMAVVTAISLQLQNSKMKQGTWVVKVCTQTNSRVLITILYSKSA